ncbi:MAG TPA: hypothetical protein ENK18_17725, partial [Deltaproteobacteria bacterium]|nr:hypothetical protein [Deltaproteobacteria bacterium]
MSTSPQPLPVRGLLWGLGYGASVSTVHLVIGMVLILAMGMPPLTWFAVKAVGAELILGALLGLIASPLLLAGDRGRLLHPAALALVWLGMERWVAVDPGKLQMWLAPPLVALVVMAIGYAIARRSPRGLIGGTVALNVVLLSMPVVRYAVMFDSSEALAERPDAAAGQPDVLFIVMDTVRAQSSSTYGYERETTPVLTQLAAEGVRFDQATAPATWSLPAHGSLFTGTFPSVHNAHAETDYLDDKLPTMAEVFQQAGYETRCFS